jgi:DNA-directed RNA polymerase II subunit RPB1
MNFLRYSPAHGENYGIFMQMNCIVPQNLQARNECMTISKVARWLISPQNQAPLAGAFQDGLIGIAEFTKDGLNFNKWHAMQMFGDTDNPHVNFNFNDKTYTNRQLISRMLPKINILGKTPTSYKKEYASLVKYNPKDIKVNIIRGELQSGVIDKATAGQGVQGSIFHIIANEYGNDRALETIYNLQQLVHRFFMYHGFTVGISDINISENAMKEVKRQIGSMILESRKITQRLNNGKLIAPLGMPLKEFYEAEQLNALTAGDGFVNPILADIDRANNGTWRLIETGSKGKAPNFIAINGAIGVQQINGKRFGPQSGWGRTSPYFTRYDTDPAANGFVSTSFREGVTSDVYAFMAGEARDGLISNALSTSITGYQNRISIKNLETIMVDNLRKSTKGMNIVQPLYAECGLDPSKTERVQFITVMMSDKDFEDQFKTKLASLDKKFQTKETAALLEQEFKQLTIDREKYRKIHMTLEDHNPKEYVMKDTKQMPINIQRIVDDTVYNYSAVTEKVEAAGLVLDPVYAIKLVNELCDNLGYAFLNELQKKQKRLIPPYLRAATNMTAILLRSYLNTSYLMKKGVVNYLLDIIVLKATNTFKRALIDYGTSVGILAAQCISEPMTQYVLDSKHRTGGGGGTKTNAIVRIKELLGARDTLAMENPHMLIIVKKEYESDQLKVQEIANHIEMMVFGRFIVSTRIFYEEYGVSTHPNYIHENAIIKEIEKHNFGQKIPSDLAKWCIRYDINKEELILKSMKLETIILAIRKTHPELFIVYSPENANNVFVRCYLRNSQFKQTNNYFEDNVLTTAVAIKKVIVRGVKDLISTSVISIIKNVISDTGSVESKTIYGIFAVGTNLADIVNNPYIDPYRTQSDSIEEMQRVFGINCAGQKIMNELTATLTDLNRMHCSIFASEMTYSGQVTPVQKLGLSKRENANITLRLSFQTPVQVIQEAAINGMIDKISGISGPLIIGTIPSAGTTYNRIAVNDEFVQANVKSLETVLEDL